MRCLALSWLLLCLCLSLGLTGKETIPNLRPLTPNPSPSSCLQERGGDHSGTPRLGHGDNHKEVQLVWRLQEVLWQRCHHHHDHHGEESPHGYYSDAQSQGGSDAHIAPEAATAGHLACAADAVGSATGHACLLALRCLSTTCQWSSVAYRRDQHEATSASSASAAAGASPRPSTG